MSLTKIVKINALASEHALIKQAAKVITSGGLVIIPTETVYGVAADAANNKALDKLYEIKQRPKDKPFAILIADMEKVNELASDISLVAYKLMRKFWPGPLTVLLKAKNGGKVGLRMPENRIALEVILQTNLALACPSANLSDQPAPINFAQALKDLNGLVDLAIDGGPTNLGIESTIVDLTVEPLEIVRHAAIKDEEIIAAIKSKRILFVCTGNSCRSVMAEAYLRKVLKNQGRNDVEVASAGMMALEGMGASEETRQVLARQGMDVSDHRTQRVTKELVDEADIILVMEKIHEERILQLEPEVKNRLFLLKEFANSVRNYDIINAEKISNGAKIDDNKLNISDPIGGSLEFYEEVFSTIKDAVERISKII
ncbi:MAG: L-threonylcarbamoyladenylate synthase [Candidatus Omnitrophota bacterium]